VKALILGAFFYARIYT